MQEYKTFSKWYIILSVAYVVTGLVMILFPSMTMALLGEILGIGMLILGIARIVIYFTRDHLESIMQPDLTIGVVFAAFGAFMLMHEDFVAMAIPFGAGILMMIGGISKVQYALDMRRLHFVHWFVMLIFAVIILVLGVILIYNPFKENVLIWYIALCLILDGIVSITAVLVISHRMNKISRGDMPMVVKGKVPGKHGADVVEDPQTPPAPEEAPQRPGQPGPYDQQIEAEDAPGEVELPPAKRKRR